MSLSSSRIQEKHLDDNFVRKVTDAERMALNLGAAITEVRSSLHRLYRFVFVLSVMNGLTLTFLLVHLSKHP
jgi:hypothetical protein